ncbi:SpoIIE family protein phosphatase [Radiobacillus kanasensis]|uniref:SpoIIE family protein phosphatase n=1 Tax=Radiobacillus kanasensis TaxID=2844358 RepID=UPI001E654DEB|nr:SpoIIE family protein phosphatase [Radiobacillus kanasensis]UFT99305.1 SpoIIE family protein phosphatase [Radiobacillus kanasensis]
MNEQLNYLPSGFITLSKNGIILSINETLLQILDYSSEALIGKHVHAILPNPARMFFQLYFIPLIMRKHLVEEMYLSIASKNGEEIPVLINASLHNEKEEAVIYCVIIPMRNRNEFEDQLLLAKELAENAFEEKNEALIELEDALKTLEDKQEELKKLNQQNLIFKTNTEKELQLAKKIQETALTKDISNEKVDILSFYRASNELSGDIYGFYQINPHQYGIILLDVMGHGISSALITMSLQSLFHRLISQGVRAEVVMQELDSHLHDLFQNNESAWHYCTAIYLFVDTKKQTMEFINAGHPPTIFQDPAGQQLELYATSPPLGTFEGIHFKSKTLDYKKGARILLYTDGVSEPLGQENLNLALQRHATLPLSVTRENMIVSLSNEAKDPYKNDDQCFILIELK